MYIIKITMENFKIKQEKIEENDDELKFAWDLEMVKNEEQVRKLCTEEIHIKDEDGQDKLSVETFKYTEGEIANYDYNIKGDLEDNFETEHVNGETRSFCDFYDDGTIIKHKINLFEETRTVERCGNSSPSISTDTDKNLYECGIENKQTVEKSQLSTSMQSQTRTKRFKCNICSYKAIYKSVLTKHLMTHTDERRFECDICGYKTNRKYDLVIHIRYHNGEKPFQCKICSYAATEKKHLTRHLKTHGKMRKCKICSYKDTSKRRFNDHLKTHPIKKPFACNICSFKASRRYALVIHMRSHTGERPFKCNICNFKTIEKCRLTSHLKKHC